MKAREWIVRVTYYAGPNVYRVKAYDEKQARKKVRKILTGDYNQRFSRITWSMAV